MGSDGRWTPARQIRIMFAPVGTRLPRSAEEPLDAAFAAAPAWPPADEELQIRAFSEPLPIRSVIRWRQAVVVDFERPDGWLQRAVLPDVELSPGPSGQVLGVYLGSPFSCMVCQDWRPEELIAVALRTVVLTSGQTVNPYNVRYCVDRPACVAYATAPGPWQPPERALTT